MSKFYASLLNLELKSNDPDEALTEASLEVVTMHIVDFVGEKFKLVISPKPLTVKGFKEEEDEEISH